MISKMTVYRVRSLRHVIHVLLLSFLYLIQTDAFMVPIYMNRFRYVDCNKKISERKLLLNFPSKMVSELHIPGYAQSKLPFILAEDEASTGLTASYMNQFIVPTKGYKLYDNQYLVHETTQPILTVQECDQIIQEVEFVASNNIVPWTTNRHGNYPTTDIPIVELKQTLYNFQRILQQRIYPNLRHQFASFLPAPDKLRVADGFVVKYDAKNGQKELRPHRDGSVLSFNIALNPSHQYIGGGTWFSSTSSSSLDEASNSNSMQDSGTVIQLEQGHMVSHASALLHGGHPISSGIRYILVAFVIVEDYDSWSMRFYNQVRNI